MLYSKSSGNGCLLNGFPSIKYKEQTLAFLEGSTFSSQRKSSGHFPLSDGAFFRRKCINLDILHLSILFSFPVVWCSPGSCTVIPVRARICDRRHVGNVNYLNWKFSWGTFLHYHMTRGSKCRLKKKFRTISKRSYHATFKRLILFSWNEKKNWKLDYHIFFLSIKFELYYGIKFYGMIFNFICLIHIKPRLMYCISMIKLIINNVTLKNYNIYIYSR